jgi:acyl-CoA synthetase (AMP-forming)/AMP-acid ligase II
MSIAPSIVGDIIERNARLFPDKTAVVFEGKHATFAQFAMRVRKLANALADRGLGRGMRLAILAQNCVEYLETVGSAELSGTIAVTLNWRLAPTELQQIVADCTPVVLVFEQRFRSQAESLRASGLIRHFVVIGEPADGAESYEEVLASGADQPPSARPDPADTVYLIYTSGTTGKPKGVELSHRAILSSAIMNSWGVGAWTSDRMLIVMPLFHIGGKICALAFQVLGATIFLHRSFDPAAILRQIEHERITCAHFAPIMVRDLLDVPGFADFRKDALRAIIYASAPMAVALLREAIAGFGLIFNQVYGMTECVVGTILHAHQHLPDGTPAEVRRLASAGQPFFDHDIKVVRADGSECATAEIGEILIRGPSLMTGYWNNPGITAEALRGGWMHTGDMGFFDEECFLFVADRKKDMIVSGGENIYSREVEEVLVTHPAVEHAAVIGVPDPRWGESVKACVVLRAGHRASEAELIEHCRSRIASYKKPRSIDFVEALPRLFNGKVDKKQLRLSYRKPDDRRDFGKL